MLWLLVVRNGTFIRINEQIWFIPKESESKERREIFSGISSYYTVNLCWWQSLNYSEELR